MRSPYLALYGSTHCRCYRCEARPPGPLDPAAERLSSPAVQRFASNTLAVYHEVAPSALTNASAFATASSPVLPDATRIVFTRGPWPITSAEGPARNLAVTYPILMWDE